MAGNLDVGDTLNMNRNPALGIGVASFQLDDHVREVKSIHALDERHAKCVSILDCPIAPSRLSGFPATENQDFIGLANIKNPFEAKNKQHDEGDKCTY